MSKTLYGDATNNMSNPERKEAIEELRKKGDEISRKLKHLIDTCEHSTCYILVNRYNGKVELLSMTCDTCGTHMGWYCKKSPDGVCHYADSEECIYCGASEERK